MGYLKLVGNRLKFPLSGPPSVRRDLYLQLAFGTIPAGWPCWLATRSGCSSFQICGKSACFPTRFPLSGIPDRSSRCRPTTAPWRFPVSADWRFGSGFNTKKELHVLDRAHRHGHRGAFSPDGAMLATCSPDQTTMMWKVDTGELLNTFRGQADEVFTWPSPPMGSGCLSLGGYDGMVKLWDPTPTAARSGSQSAHPRGLCPGRWAAPVGGLVTFIWRVACGPAVLYLSLETTVAQVPICPPEESPIHSG